MSGPYLQFFRTSVFGMSAMMIGIGQVQATDAFTQALTSGDPLLDMRLRYENVDQAGFAEKAEALTLRTRLGYQTGTFEDFSALVEMENTSDAGMDDFDPENPGFPRIGDPTLTELNQLLLQYSGLDKTQARIGRQRILLDNSRFVGNAPWRQNEQTFDGFTLQSEAAEALTLFYGYLDNAQTVSGTKRKMDSHLLNAQYSGLPLGSLTLYSYLLDFDTSTDTQTFGLRFNGKSEIDRGVHAIYTAEFANQSDYADSTDIDANYWLLELSLGNENIAAKTGYAVLGSDDGAYGFSTPLASLFAFQGLADVLTTTPATGTEDTYAGLEIKVTDIALAIFYHDFNANEGNLNHGDEWDLSASKKFGKHYSVGTGYVSYDADTFAVDTDKFWIWGETKF